MKLEREKMLPILLLFFLWGGVFELFPIASSHKESVSVVKPGSGNQPPSDAVILFDGTDASQFTELDGSPAVWKVVDGSLIAGEHDVISKFLFSDAQVHVEFNLPRNDPKYGNSGLYFHQLYELQILDSHRPNRFAPNQQCASFFSLHAPLVNASRPPGEWQTYDIVFQGARLDEAGNVAGPARFTVFHNGVLVQDDCRLSEGTGAGRRNPMVSKGPLKLQAHGSPVRFRNIWMRPLK